MEVKTRCIALRTIKYKDNRAIASCLSRELGRLSLSVPDGKGLESRRRRALLMPGGVFECIVDVRDGSEVLRPRDVWGVSPLLLDNPAKGAIVLFLCDFMMSLLRDAQPDELLFDYVAWSLDELVRCEQIGNFPTAFLIGLQRYMGIEPDVSEYREGMCFDMLEGVFREGMPPHRHFLAPVEAGVAARLLRMNYRNMGVYRLRQDVRRRVMDVLLEYYSIHFGQLRGLNSLDVMREIFS